MTRNLALTEGRKWVSIKPGADPRSRTVSITAQGRAMVRAMARRGFPYWSQAQQQVGKLFGRRGPGGAEYSGLAQSGMNAAASGHRGWLLAWNALGTLDLILAVSLRVISAPGSPLQLFGGTVGSAAIWTLPWSNIPTLLVPFYLITHGIIFVRLLSAAPRRG